MHENRSLIQRTLDYIPCMAGHVLLIDLSDELISCSEFELSAPDFQISGTFEEDLERGIVLGAQYKEASSIRDPKHLLQYFRRCPNDRYCAVVLIDGMKVTNILNSLLIEIKRVGVTKATFVFHQQRLEVAGRESFISRFFEVFRAILFCNVEVISLKTERRARNHLPLEWDTYVTEIKKHFDFVVDLSKAEIERAEHGRPLRWLIFDLKNIKRPHRRFTSHIECIARKNV